MGLKNNSFFTFTPPFLFPSNNYVYFKKNLYVVVRRGVERWCGANTFILTPKLLCFRILFYIRSFHFKPDYCVIFYHRQALFFKSFFFSLKLTSILETKDFKLNNLKYGKLSFLLAEILFKVFYLYLYTSEQCNNFIEVLSPLFIHKKINQINIDYIFSFISKLYISFDFIPVRLYCGCINIFFSINKLFEMIYVFMPKKNIT